MKLSHTAALALVGWYLMVPPQIPLPGGKLGIGAPDTNAPLSEWSILDTFDSATECKNAAESYPRMNQQFGNAPESRSYVRRYC
jgi:hypothetical protein